MVVTVEKLQQLAQAQADAAAQVDTAARKANDTPSLLDKATADRRPDLLPDGAVVPPKTIPDVTLPGGVRPSFPLIPGIVLTPVTPLTPTGPAGAQSLGNPQFDGMLNQIVELNTDIDSLLADYQKAVNGELLDASGKKVDPFVIQMKLQQAMQQRLEISNLLSTLMKMVHDGIEAITRNIA